MRALPNCGQSAQSQTSKEGSWLGHCDRKTPGGTAKGHGNPAKGRRFPYLAETLRQAGVTRNFWYLPACQSLYLTEAGPVMTLGTPLVTGTVDVPRFDREALIAALRTDQAGRSTFLEFLAASWRAGVVRYDVDLIARTCTYFGALGEEYVESYPVVDVA
jgi:uncharacterized protein YbcV (DUF1398 family)